MVEQTVADIVEYYMSATVYSRLRKIVCGTKLKGRLLMLAWAHWWHLAPAPFVDAEMGESGSILTDLYYCPGSPAS